MNNYSVLMSVYFKEKPEFLELAINSVLKQTIQTDDFVIVCDGELTDELNSVINNFEKKYSFFHILRFNENRGLGDSLRDGLIYCKNDFVMRMDSDDYSLPNRAEEQIKVLMNGFDITSSSIAEFDTDEKNPTTIRKVPITDKDIRRYIKKRSPFNHPAVMFRRSAVLRAGNYRKFLYQEDYDLWIRMIKTGCKMQNTEEPLLYMRAGLNMINRRFSKQAKASRKCIRKELLENKLINRFEYFVYSTAESIIGIMPMRIKKAVYRIFLRKKYDRKKDK